MNGSPANQQEEAIMTIALKIAQRAVLAAMFVSTAAIAQTPSHEDITVTPKQENVWGARVDVPNQEQTQAYVTKNVWGAQIEVPVNQVSVARTPAQAPAAPSHN
jgi:hypothetical protein